MILIMKVGLFGLVVAIVVASWLAYQHFKGKEK